MYFTYITKPTNSQSLEHIKIPIKLDFWLKSHQSYFDYFFEKHKAVRQQISLYSMYVNIFEWRVLDIWSKGSKYYENIFILFIIIWGHFNTYKCDEMFSK